MIYHIYIYIFVYICIRGRWFEKWGRTGTPRQGDLFVLIHFFRWTLKCFISGLRKTPFLRQTSAGNWKTKVRRKQKKTHPWPPSKGVSTKKSVLQVWFLVVKSWLRGTKKQVRLDWRIQESHDRVLQWPWPEGTSPQVVGRADAFTTWLGENSEFLLGLDVDLDCWDTRTQLNK